MFSLILVCAFCEASYLIPESALLSFLQRSIEGFCYSYPYCDRHVYLTQHVCDNFTFYDNQEQPIDLSCRGGAALDLALNDDNLSSGLNSAVSEVNTDPGLYLNPEPRAYTESNVYPNPNIGLGSSNLNSTEVAIDLTTCNRGVRDRPNSSGNGKYWRSWL